MNVKCFLNQIAKFFNYFCVVTELHNNYVLWWQSCVWVQSSHFNWKPRFILWRSGYDLDIFIQSRFVQVYTTILQQFLQTLVQYMINVWCLALVCVLQTRLRLIRAHPLLVDPDTIWIFSYSLKLCTKVDTNLVLNT